MFRSSGAAMVLSACATTCAWSQTPDLVALVPDAGEKVHELLQKTQSLYAKQPRTSKVVLGGELLGKPSKISVWKSGNRLVDEFKLGIDGDKSLMTMVAVIDDGNATIIKNGREARVPGQLVDLLHMGKGDPLGTIAAMLKTAHRVGVGHGHVDDESVTWLVLHQARVGRHEQGMPWQVGFYATGAVAGLVHPIPVGHGMSVFIGMDPPKQGAAYPVASGMSLYMVHESVHGGFSISAKKGGVKIGHLKVETMEFNEPVDAKVFDVSTWEAPHKKKE